MLCGFVITVHTYTTSSLITKGPNCLEHFFKYIDITSYFSEPPLEGPTEVQPSVSLKLLQETLRICCIWKTVAAHHSLICAITVSLWVKHVCSKTQNCLEYECLMFYWYNFFILLWEWTRIMHLRSNHHNLSNLCRKHWAYVVYHMFHSYTVLYSTVAN